MLSIEQQFIDHLPETEQCKNLHEKCNALASEFAFFIASNLKDEQRKNTALQLLQQLRLITNHGFEIDELNFIEEYKQRVGEIEEEPIMESITAPVEKDDIWDDVPKNELSSRIKRKIKTRRRLK